jgi:PAS domain S-box-containing protein
MIHHPGAWVIHDGHTIQQASESFCTLFRCDLDNLIGRRMESIIADPDARSLALLRGARIINRGADEVHQMDYKFLRCDGSLFWGTAHSRKLDIDLYVTLIRLEYDTY